MGRHPAGKNSVQKLLQKQRGNRQKQFLEQYARCGNLTEAARKCRIDRNRHYDWLQDPEYEAKFANAYAQACDIVDGEIRRRGVTGILKPVFYKGEKVGSIREYSDTLLIFLAKGMMPDKYAQFIKGDIEHSGTISRAIDFAELSDEQLDTLQKWTRAAVGSGSKTLEILAEPDVSGSGDRTEEEEPDR
jgi:hypothetical protein